MTTLLELQVARLGDCRFDSPLGKYVAGRRTNEHYVDEDDRVLFDDTVELLRARDLPLDELPTFEPGGPRRRIFFEPGATKVGIVTCGGLCPGLNDVVRGLVLELHAHYGVDILFVIGGDGSMRGAAGLAAVLLERDLPIGVIGIPKTIDNDIPFIGQSFGFQTAYTTAAQSIQAARVEAQSAVNGVGMVRVMGRHSGFIACYAALSVHRADFVLVPEVPFALDGPGGFLACLHRAVLERGSAVVVVAEGAGQEIVHTEGADASGNSTLVDIGVHLKQQITAHFANAGDELTLKYIDPGYTIRSVPAQAHDAVSCVRLAQAAVHAGMAGRTKMVVGRRHNRFIHVPIAQAVSYRNQVAPDGDLWLSVLESTAQPAEMR